MRPFRAKRYLIVNADDFGQGRGINRGVIYAHEHGIVTSASLMVRWPAAGEAAAYSRRHPELSVGLHFDFGEWAYRRKAWVPVYQVVPDHDPAAVKEEADRQLARFRHLVGKDPTHLDSHQHAHMEEPVRSVIAGIARRLGVPVRQRSPEVHYCGDFYGQTAEGRGARRLISPKALLRILATLPPGFTEVGCHPALGNDVDSMYVSERTKEVRTLCHHQVREAMTELGIELCSFSELLFPRAKAKA